MGLHHGFRCVGAAGDGASPSTVCWRGRAVKATKRANFGLVDLSCWANASYGLMPSCVSRMAPINVV
ncbi:hypothetical protein L1887_06102 [Cichorium endivia]|nr:hypothetical protein L1887_06102 [Cichorium endivia]